MKCQGPCLPYCFSKNEIFYLTIGAFIGYFITVYILKYDLHNSTYKKY